jgi:hypothetical protein
VIVVRKVCDRFEKGDCCVNGLTRVMGSTSRNRAGTSVHCAAASRLIPWHCSINACVVAVDNEASCMELMITEPPPGW